MEFESSKERADRLYRHLDHLIKRIEAGEKPGPLREQLTVDLMMSPVLGAEEKEVYRRFDDAVAARHAWPS